jgi:hypothetical protein
MCNKIHENINETLTEIRFSMYANIFTKGDTMRRDAQTMEEYLLARGIRFPQCPKCPERKEGCHKNCKFIKAYKKEKNDEPSKNM